MSVTHLIIPDQHAHPKFNNDRADWMGQLIHDVKPDLVINIGDAADMSSLSAFDKGKASFFGESYGKDIDAHLDFQERMWAPSRKAKKRMPHRVVFEGNHEHRIKRVLEYDPQLASGKSKFGISFSDLDFDSYYNEVHEYEGGTPAVRTYDGVSYAHFFISGLMGRPIGGDHHAANLINKNHCSCTCGHSHTADYAIRTDAKGNKIMGCVAGVYQDYDAPWAGKANALWWGGAVIKRNVSEGKYDPQFVSINTLRKEYGQ